ncbi:hypothetical protein KY285_013015 [Solanum tuberosum]|nr:hypothetical protein KY285_013015 [Solanum tuberosum]
MLEEEEGEVVMGRMYLDEMKMWHIYSLPSNWTFRVADSLLSGLWHIYSLPSNWTFRVADSLLSGLVGFQRSLDRWRQTQPTSEDGSTTQLTSDDITSIWTNVAGGVKKGRVYGLGAQPSSCHPSPLLSANYAKVQKFMEKHMVESDDGEEETDSDEE